MNGRSPSPQDASGCGNGFPLSNSMSSRVYFGIDPAPAAGEEDAGLIGLMAGGDTLALRRLYALYSGPLYSYALRALGSVEDAEEALQDVFIRLWKKAPDYDAARSGPFTWAWMLMRGLCIDRLRRRGRRAIIDEGPSMDDPAALPLTLSVPPVLAQRDEIRRVLRAMEQLPTADRRAVEMSVFLEYTGEEIANTLNQPLGTIKSRIRRGLHRLRQILQSHD